MKNAKPTTRQRTAPRTETTDPIWAVIEKHRKERAAYDKASREKWVGDIDIPHGAINKVWAAGHPLLSTRPTTLAGAIGILQYVGSQVDKSDPCDAGSPTFLPDKVDGVFWAYAFFENIADALAALCGREAVASSNAQSLTI